MSTTVIVKDRQYSRVLRLTQESGEKWEQRKVTEIGFHNGQPYMIGVMGEGDSDGCDVHLTLEQLKVIRQHISIMIAEIEK